HHRLFFPLLDAQRLKRPSQPKPHHRMPLDLLPRIQHFADMIRIALTELRIIRGEVHALNALVKHWPHHCYHYDKRTHRQQKLLSSLTRLNYQKLRGCNPKLRPERPPEAKQHQQIGSAAEDRPPQLLPSPACDVAHPQREHSREHHGRECRSVE